MRRHFAWMTFRHSQILALHNLEIRAVFNKFVRYSPKLEIAASYLPPFVPPLVHIENPVLVPDESKKKKEINLL